MNLFLQFLVKFCASQDEEESFHNLPVVCGFQFTRSRVRHRQVRIVSILRFLLFEWAQCMKDFSCCASVLSVHGL